MAKMADIQNKLRNAMKPNSSETTEKAMNAIINNDIREVVINFNYDSLNLEKSDLEELQEHEKALLMQGKSLNRISIKIGEHLHKAKEILIKTHRDSFMEWYEALGLKKDQVSIFMNRYKLALDFPEAKDIILSLSDRVIKESINKKNPENLLERVVRGEIRTAEEIREIRKNISAGAEIFSKNIEEAQIVGENYKIKIGIQKDVIVDKVKAITKTDRETFEKLLKIQEILKSME
jgi:hypothetical protein